MSHNGDVSIGRGGAKEHRWRGFVTEDAGADRAMPDDSSAKNPSASERTLTSSMSHDGDISIGCGGAEEHRWRGFATEDAGADRSMPDDSGAKNSSASASAGASSAENLGAESRARGENGRGCKTVRGGVCVNMLVMAKFKRSTSWWYSRRARSTGDNRAWRASRAELSNSQDVIRSCRRSWNNWVTGRAELGNGLSRACWYFGCRRDFDELVFRARRGKAGDCRRLNCAWWSDCCRDVGHRSC